MKQIFIISDISAVTCRFPEAPPPSREDPAQVQVLRYIPDMSCILSIMNKKTREANPLHVADLPLVSYNPPRKEKNQVIKVRYLYASSCEYLPKASYLLPPPSFSFKEVRAGQLGGINGTTAIKSPMKGSHFSSYRVGPFVNQRNGGTKSRIWYLSRA